MGNVGADAAVGLISNFISFCPLRIEDNIIIKVFCGEVGEFFAVPLDSAGAVGLSVPASKAVVGPAKFVRDEVKP